MNFLTKALVRWLLLPVVFMPGLAMGQEEPGQPALQPECVGRYQLKLPTNIEIALRTPVSLYSQKDEDRQVPYRFKDGTKAYFSKGDAVTDVMSPEDFSALSKKIVEKLQKKAALLSEREAPDFKQFDLGLESSLVWRSRLGVEIYLYRGGRVFDWGTGGDFYTQDDKAEFENQVAIAKNYAATFRVRNLFELPAQEGLCIPYGFIPDDGKAPRDIAVTVRPVDHPEVLITFADETIEGDDPRISNRDKLVDILHYEYGHDSPKMKQLDQHKQQIAGRAGETIFVRLYRKTGQEDYLYLANVFGSKKAPTDTPTLNLRIERNSALTKSTPISEKDFKKLAERIAASIQRRAVTQP